MDVAVDPARLEGRTVEIDGLEAGICRTDRAYHPFSNLYLNKALALDLRMDETVALAPARRIEAGLGATSYGAEEEEGSHGVSVADPA